MNMKNSTLPILAFLAVTGALALLAASAVAATIAFSVAGIISVAVADYGRNLEPLRAKSRVIPFDGAGRPEDTLRDAA
jgi:hypothetical protein